ncbi:MAG: succinylglutamate desuccinylase/aspartoacylase family protein [Hyphomonadaceae bacterium]|nr:succinylglutamate desuccinylase/aspartoacylase family protein [Hyphomonadaceae bacterium]
MMENLNMRLNKSVSILGAFALAACATSSIQENTGLLPALRAAGLCETDNAAISIEHATANVSDCRVVSDTSLELMIRPENTPINDSPWYGFRVDPKIPGILDITLSYEGGTHRYHPKVSYDGRSWDWLAQTQIDVDEDNGQTASIRLNLGQRPFFVSAQEIFTSEKHDRWARKLAERSDTTLSEIGRSHDGHPLLMLEVETEPDTEKPYVMWVGRQHPPEVTGALFLISFTETILGDSGLSQKFLNRFNLLIVPNMNPDGVTAGFWRHNKGGIDLNRDWGPFTQPETQAVRSALERFETGEDRIALFLDFHSTKRNLLYTQTDEEPASPPMFARDWAEAVDERLDDEVYSFTREPRPMSARAISKNYMYKNYGIAAITFEVGDATDRDAVREGAIVFAEEMMKIMIRAEESR